MTGRIRIDLKIVGRFGFTGCLQQGRTQRHDRLMSGCEVVDPEIQVDLLRNAVRPLGADVVGCELYPYTGFSIDEHHVPVRFGVNGAAQHAGPEITLTGQVRSVEDDDLMFDPHGGIVACRRTPRAPAVGSTNTH